ncbi:MAG: hypothetical protein IKL10_01185 [Clostridia bacterium]|nr:hypothetical protein [Clostridia bacterium]
MVFDTSIKELITAAFNDEKDVFLKNEFPVINELYFDNVKTAVFLPGSFYGGKDFPFSDYLKGATFTDYLTSNDNIVSDIRFMGEASFREYLHKNKFKRLIVLFAECADTGEYGYREALRWIGEFRAENDSFCQVVAFFSPVETDFEYYLTAFSCREVIFAGENTLPDIKVFEAVSPAAKFYYTASVAEKYAYKKVCVYFNSRTEASDFGRFLMKRGTSYLYFDGSLAVDEKKKVLNEYIEGKVSILIATKAFITETLFFYSDICIFCGVPFSLSHLYRSSLAAENSRLHIIFCEEDIERNEKISRSFAAVTNLQEVYEKRQNRLFDIKKLISDIEKE